LEGKEYKVRYNNPSRRRSLTYNLSQSLPRKETPFKKPHQPTTSTILLMGWEWEGAPLKACLRLIINTQNFDLSMSNEAADDFLKRTYRIKIMKIFFLYK
jgi:hypothetical protein